MSRLDTFDYLPRERAECRHLHHWCEIFAGRFRVCDDCPPELRAEAEAYCRLRNEESNRSACRAYRARLLP